MRAQAELARLHRAAVATDIRPLFYAEPFAGTEGDDCDAFSEPIESASYARNDVYVGCAHQMGSCRMGSDPSGYVADGRGELHDVKGVWIGDGSAFPTPSGTNPMVSIMALEHRTAEAIVGAPVDTAVAAAR